MNGIQVNGSSRLALARYGGMFRLVEDDKIDPGAVVTDRIALDGVSDELEAMTEYRTVGIPVVDEFA